jgi:hypothetical protein
MTIGHLRELMENHRVGELTAALFNPLHPADWDDPRHAEFDEIVERICSGLGMS